MTDPLNFVTDQEPWNVYRLEDGTVIRAKIVMTRVTIREGAVTDDGFPIYDLRWQHIVDVTPSELSKVARQSSDLMDRLKPKDSA